MRKGVIVEADRTIEVRDAERHVVNHLIPLS